MATEAEKKANAVWKKEHTKQYGIRVTNASGIPAALSDATIYTGKTPSAYIKQALIRQLKRDGFEPIPKDK